MATVEVLCSGAFVDVLRCISQDVERSTGVALNIKPGMSSGDSSRAIPWRLQHGEAADLVIVFDEVLDDLVGKELVDADSKLQVAASKLGMAIRRGEELPDISTSIGLRQALVKADSIAYSASSSGIFVSEVLFPRLGIVDVVGPKSRRIDTERVGAVVARGGAEIGFQQISELVPFGDLLVVGKLPDELQQTKIISAGICAGAANRMAAQLVCRNLSQPQAAEHMAKGGLDPL
jgi:molybdate transport system substrate-binding protein